jgi:hypothetical protein
MHLYFDYQSNLVSIDNYRYRIENNIEVLKSRFLYFSVPMR